MSFLCQNSRRTLRTSFLTLLATSAFTSISASLPEVAQADVQTPGSQHPLLSIPLTRKKVPVKRAGRIVSHKTTYSGTINVGFPRQQFRVVFDTGSGHVVLPGTECKSQACTVHRRYSQAASPAAIEINIDQTPTVVGEPYDEVTVNYGTGQIVGVFVNESVCVGDVQEDTELCVNMGFVKASELSHNPFAYFPVDGVFGLGLQSLALNPAFNFFNVYARHELVKVAQFSMFIGEGDQDSELVFGGYNPRHLASPLKWSPVAMPEMGHWQIILKAIHVNGRKVDVCQDEVCRAIFDTGTSHLGVPNLVEKTFENLLSVPANGIDNCLHASGLEISFEFAGFNLTLGPDSYMRRMPLSDAVLNGYAVPDIHNSSDKSTFQGNLTTSVDTSKADDSDAHETDIDLFTDLWCRPLLMPVSLPEPLGPNLFILGEPLLRRYYTVFDWATPALGFGLAAKKHETTEDPVIFLQESIKKKDGSALFQVTIVAKRKVFDEPGLLLLDSTQESTKPNDDDDDDDDAVRPRQYDDGNYFVQVTFVATRSLVVW